MTDFFPRFAAAMALGACLLAATASANADARYPARPLRMVVPYAAGGPTDTFARALAESWARALGGARGQPLRRRHGGRHRSRRQGRAGWLHHADDHRGARGEPAHLRQAPL